MSSVPLQIMLSPAVSKLLDENGIDLVRELQKQGLEAGKSYGANASGVTGSREKEVTLIILASSAAVLAISTGITKIIDALSRGKKVVATHLECVPVLDGNGNALKHPDGAPILQWIERTELIESRVAGQEKSNFAVSATPSQGFRFDITSG